MISRRRRKAICRASAIYLAAAVVPLYALVLTSVQPENLMRSRDIQVIPSHIILDHYQAVLAPGHIVPLRQGMLNSLLVSLCTAAFCVLLALPAAYALAMRSESDGASRAMPGAMRMPPSAASDVPIAQASIET